MSKSMLGTDTVVQIGIVVKNIEETGKKYAEFLGVELPPFKVSATVDKTHAVYRGKPMQGRTKQMFFKLENIEIELMEPDEGPSTWREFLDTKGEGIHHIAFRIKNTEEKLGILEGAGMKLIQKGDYVGGMYSYVDGAKDLKIILELLENF